MCTCPWVYMPVGVHARGTLAVVHWPWVHWHVAPLACSTTGTLVHWHPGPLAPWSMVHWHPGPWSMVHWHPGPWSIGILVHWHPGPLASWSIATLGQATLAPSARLHWHPRPGYIGTLVHWHPGPLAPWTRGTVDPWTQEKPSTCPCNPPVGLYLSVPGYTTVDDWRYVLTCTATRTTITGQEVLTRLHCELGNNLAGYPRNVLNSVVN